MSMSRGLGVASLLMASAQLAAQDPQTVGDLPEDARVPMSRDELSALLPGAKVVSLSGRGSQRIWTNESGGSFVASSNNAAGVGQPTMAQGKWHVSDDGRYCVLIEWRSAGPEQWCRYVVKVGGAYYATRSSTTSAERLYKLEISK